MASSLENNDLPSLSKLFDDQLKICHEIENTDLPSNSEELKKKILGTIKKLEDITVQISYLGIFSSNESYEELSSSSIKFLMLPVLLGTLTLKLHPSDRENLLKVAHIYFKDFLRRCSQYELAHYIEEDEETSTADDVNASEIKVTQTTHQIQDLQRMAKQREEKIGRYKRKKGLKEKLDELRKKVDFEDPNCDEDIAREYFSTMIQEFICQSQDEMDSISMELKMLHQMKQMNVNKENVPKVESTKPLRPFLIARNALQKEVFGAGYPSLPVMSVEEFYEQRVKEGVFPAPGDEQLSRPTTDDATNQQSSDDDEDIDQLRQRDEWRETHRRGWGNTYNRS